MLEVWKYIEKKFTYISLTGSGFPSFIFTCKKVWLVTWPEILPLQASTVSATNQRASDQVRQGPVTCLPFLWISRRQHPSSSLMSPRSWCCCSPTEMSRRPCWKHHPSKYCAPEYPQPRVNGTSTSVACVNLPDDDLGGETSWAGCQSCSLPSWAPGQITCTQDGSSTHSIIVHFSWRKC